MQFQQPVMLVGLILPIALAAFHVVFLRHRRRDVLKFTALETLESILPRRLERRVRHVPVILLIGSLLVFVIGAAQPLMSITKPRSDAAVVLVLDVSLSMQARDVAPSRLEAAKTAANAFVDQLPPEVNLGVASFAGTASVLYSPGTDREAAKRSISDMATMEATATGEAIFTGLQAIENFRRSLGVDSSDLSGGRIVLLSDGSLTVPRIGGEGDPRGSYSAARIAGQRHVPVDTISFGTAYGVISMDGMSQDVPVDDDSMGVVARLSGGQFDKAASLDELLSVYSSLAGEVGYEERREPDSYPWLVGGAILVAVGLTAGFMFNRRIP